ncbi:MAG TPA: hypothetical protein VIK56_03185 [Rhodoferax sp.]
MTTQKQIEARYPYMFSGENIGISIPRGWIGIFEKLCAKIDNLLGSDKRGFHWTQCKEKFGSGRWYWGMTGIKAQIRLDLISPTDFTSSSTRAESNKSEDEALSLQLNELIDAGEKETTHSCIVCGKHGKNDRGDGWYVVLCPEHAQMRRQGDLPSIWFGDEDDE